MMMAAKDLSIHRKDGYQDAEFQLVKDLIDAILLEDLFSIHGKGDVIKNPVESFHLKDGESLFEVPLSKEESILFPVRVSALHSYRLSGRQVYLWQKEQAVLQEMGLMQTAQLFMNTYGKESGYSEENRSQFLDELMLARKQTALTHERAKIMQRIRLTSFIETEQLAAFRDRPFHPTAKAKEGWTEEEYRLYSPEFQQTIKLGWIAVHRDYIHSGGNAKEEVLYDLLTEQESAQLTAAFEKKGIALKDYVAIPIHPWQEKNVIATLYKEEIDQKICVPLDVQLGEYHATSSLRSLAPTTDSSYHIKLPIGISSLGALRLMPPRYLLNGVKGQKLLERVKKRDSYLKQHLFICDECHWWAFHDSEQNLYADKPGHLTCQIRSYPSVIMNKEKYALVSMAALAVGKEEHLFTQWLHKQEHKVTQENVIQLFEGLCREFALFACRFLQYGIMPELHGQNVVVVLKENDLSGFLLRDHDTVRIFPEWMEKADLKDPGYVIRKDTPNTLINQNPEEFLAYFQTLAIEVNLYAIVDSLCSVYQLDEHLLWKIVKDSLQEAITYEDFTQEQRKVIYNILFSNETWPVKRLLDPLLRRKGSGGGSMPSSIGRIHNPFRSREKIQE
ncbi:IucA/IucC family protein [Pseudobacillus wudalianchiensis]|uniref:IucA/IucC family siderophore biosynthesis protein n=1 Tax=Pseudobacillus wudalianchiensis TaxID=1743143 RepID=A0A1B9AM55_9BACI|nr:IucA/IucC family protein [Bacillus wudalianchiensis]OCA84977.1 hypothetical protein A8F95_09730 [Bacillus wudalianchiensis]